MEVHSFRYYQGMSICQIKAWFEEEMCTSDYFLLQKYMEHQTYDLSCNAIPLNQKDTDGMLAVIDAALLEMNLQQGS